MTRFRAGHVPVMSSCWTSCETLALAAATTTVLVGNEIHLEPGDELTFGEENEHGADDEEVPSLEAATNPFTE